MNAYLNSLWGLILHWLGLNPDWDRQVDAARILAGEPPRLEWSPEELENLVRTREIISELKQDKKK